MSGEKSNPSYYTNKKNVTFNENITNHRLNSKNHYNSKFTSMNSPMKSSLKNNRYDKSNNQNIESSVYTIESKTPKILIFGPDSKNVKKHRQKLKIRKFHKKDKCKKKSNMSIITFFDTKKDQKKKKRKKKKKQPKKVNTTQKDDEILTTKNNEIINFFGLEGTREEIEQKMMTNSNAGKNPPVDEFKFDASSSHNSEDFKNVCLESK